MAEQIIYAVIWSGYAYRIRIRVTRPHPHRPLTRLQVSRIFHRTLTRGCTLIDPVSGRSWEWPIIYAGPPAAHQWLRTRTYTNGLKRSLKFPWPDAPLHIVDPPLAWPSAQQTKEFWNSVSR